MTRQSVQTQPDTKQYAATYVGYSPEILEVDDVLPERMSDAEAELIIDNAVHELRAVVLGAFALTSSVDEAHDLLSENGAFSIEQYPANIDKFREFVQSHFLPYQIGVNSDVKHGGRVSLSPIAEVQRSFAGFALTRVAMPNGVRLQSVMGSRTHHPPILNDGHQSLSHVKRLFTLTTIARSKAYIKTPELLAITQVMGITPKALRTHVENGLRDGLLIRKQAVDGKRIVSYKATELLRKIVAEFSDGFAGFVERDAATLASGHDNMDRLLKSDALPYLIRQAFGNVDRTRMPTLVDDSTHFERIFRQANCAQLSIVDFYDRVRAHGYNGTYAAFRQSLQRCVLNLPGFALELAEPSRQGVPTVWRLKNSYQFTLE